MADYFIIDTDAGVDDAVAIMMALDLMSQAKNSDKKLLGITCCAGNTKVDKVARNVHLTLKIMRRMDIKIFKGCHCSIMNKYESYYYFGSDGLGNMVHKYEPLDVKVEQEHAVNALIKFVKEYPKQVSIVCIGPLTNIALASRIEPKFFELTKSLLIMGGNIDGLGNATAAAEFNFYYDPEAVDIVLTNVQCPITILPWELAYRTHISWCVLEKQNFPAKVELNGELTRGQLVVDKRSVSCENGIEFILKVDVQYLKDLYEKMLL
ncbi:inosine-uridine preferring nucleoside hydrolase-like protein [Dinothrombium tinctorium]|uniref:Inosine-uridine preferring nucleoside hydrolase-like protein n=1 Tax=Dinothrombium tinctorium TaxID=1965070 RepID=A0A3S3NLV8_9ACAR|nr:inosine-uridine preferring nucleoside hydrolase-like protein [Dinothrombium tinctorium]